MDALDVFAPMEPPVALRPALVTERETWTFADVARIAAALARRLEARGIAGARGGDHRTSRVAFRASSSPETFLAIHTLAALGVTIVPIHPRLSPSEVAVLLDVTRPDHVLDEADLTLPSPDEIRAAREAAPSREAGAARETAPSREARSSRAVALGPRSRSLAEGPPPFAIVSTSGTTGRPKGAVLSRRAILASAEASAQNLGWEEGDRWLLCMPLAHVGGLSIVTRCLIARRTVVMLPRFDARLVLDAIRAHRVTLLSVVPTMLHALLEADHDGALLLPRALLLGGAAAPPVLLDECARRGVRALTTYGLTEACSQVTSQAPGDPSMRRAGSGAPLPGMEVRIVAEGSLDLAPLAPRTVGSILVRGAALFDGYLRPDGTLDPARVATPAQQDQPTDDRAALDPARVATPAKGPDLPAPDAGFFATGDLGELDEEGQLFVHVRRTDLIVTGGENVYPVEVEQALERLPGVRRAAVFGVPDERWGQIVAAAIEPSPGTSPDARMIIDVLSTTLAPHKHPRRWVFVDSLPLTSSGKLHRAALAPLYGPALRPAS